MDDPDTDKNPDVSAAYAQADEHDSIGMRALAGLFLLEHEFRRVPERQYLARLVVNRLNRFVPYDCAIFWICSPRGRVSDVTVSGVVKSKDTRSVLRWATALGKWLDKTGWNNTQINPAVVNSKRTLTNWPENLTKSGLYVPLRSQSGKLRGGIVLLREAAWSQPVRVMLDQLAEATAYTMDALDMGVHGHRRARGLIGRLFVPLVALLVGGSFFIPVSVHVDVPARLVISENIMQAPPGPAQIDMQVPLQGAMALRSGTRLTANHRGMMYELEVEYITPWLAGLFADRQIRVRVIQSPDGLAPPALQRITTENAYMSLPLYVVRRPIGAVRRYFNLD